MPLNELSCCMPLFFLSLSGSARAETIVCAPTGRGGSSSMIALRFSCLYASIPQIRSIIAYRVCRESLSLHHAVYNMIHDSGAHYNVLDMHDITTAPLFVVCAFLPGNSPF
jgi:hypothetical protein